MRKGSVLCFNGYLLHSSLPNFSDVCRPALTMHFCSMNTLLTWGGAATDTAAYQFIMFSICRY